MEDEMKTRSGLFMLLVIAAMLALAACGGAVAPTEPPMIYEAPAATEAPAMEAPYAGNDQLAQSGAPMDKTTGQEQPANAAAAMPTVAAFEITNSSGDLTVIERSNRMIIKNADVRLTVEDTDVAIDRATQIVGDAGGYIVSSRVWYQDYYGNNLKYASITIGVPVGEFENCTSSEHLGQMGQIAKVRFPGL
jgi:hypothetical protein